MPIYYFGNNFAEIAGRSLLWHKTFPKMSQMQDSIFTVESIKKAKIYPTTECKKNKECNAAIFASCTSTFDMMEQLESQQGFTDWDWVMACYQTQGHGQYGRQWYSPLGNLCVSQMLPAFSANDAPDGRLLLPMLIVGIVIQVLRELGISVYLKWPNDLIYYCSGEIKKVGGLLLKNRINSFILGLGINFAPDSSLITRNIQENGLNHNLPILPPGTLPNPDNLIEFWKTCSTKLQRAWQRWQASSISTLRLEIENLMAFRGQLVEFFEIDSNGRINRTEGQLHGLGDSGELILGTKKSQQKKIRGSLRPISDISGGIL